MNILGIETSCDETAAAVVDQRLRIKSSVVASQIDLHRMTHGVVPEVAARAHTEKILPVIDEALRRARIHPRQLSAIAVTRGPGLITSLLVGIETAKALSFGWSIPLIGINHIEGHVLSSLLERNTTSRIQQLRINKKRLPLVVLTVSGGHTELMLLKNIGQYHILGRTRDDAAGEAFDKVARLLGLPYPGGPAISAAAERGNDQRFAFPRPMLKSPDLDFSFAGLKTAVSRELAHLSRGQLARSRSDIAASFQRAVIDTLAGKLERAARQYRAREVWLVGGVAANALLRREVQAMAKRLKIALRIPSFEFCTDNAVMIAAVGATKLARRQFDDLGLEADPNLDLTV